MKALFLQNPIKYVYQLHFNQSFQSIWQVYPTFCGKST